MRLRNFPANKSRHIFRKVFQKTFPEHVSENFSRERFRNTFQKSVQKILFLKQLSTKLSRIVSDIFQNSQHTFPKYPTTFLQIYLSRKGLPDYLPESLLENIIPQCQKNTFQKRIQNTSFWAAQPRYENLPETFSKKRI